MASLTEEQRMAVESIDRNVLVAAGAGSGKTHVLVERYIEILRQNRELSVSNLVAVTYTTKAANEMRSRLKSRMQELANRSEGENRDFWGQCLAEVDAARIGTIHSLCESILKAFPVEAAIDPRFEVLGDLERAELLDESLDQSIHEAAIEDGEERLLLLSHAIETIKDSVRKLIESALQFREARERLPGLEDEQLEEHCRHLMEIVHSKVLGGIRRNPRWHELVSYLQGNPWTPAGLLEDHRRRIVELCLSVAEFDPHSSDGVRSSETGERIGNLFQILAVKVATAGGNSEEAKALRAGIRELKEFLEGELKDIPAALSDVDREAFKHIRGLLRLSDRVLKRFDHAKTASMRLDFNDLIWRAHAVLALPGSAARRFYNGNVRAILVDEFQDTNRLQAQLIYMLAAEKTRLFLIGDDKQSIYKFQGADVSIFNEWRGYFGQSDKPQEACNEAAVAAGDALERVEPPDSEAASRGAAMLRPSNQKPVGAALAAARSTRGGRAARARSAYKETAYKETSYKKPPLKLAERSLLINLSKSFRSHPEIVNFVNAVFERLLPADELDSDYKAHFRPLSAHRTDASNGVRLEVVLFDARDQNGDRQLEEAKRMEAESVASWIARKVLDQQLIFDKSAGAERAIRYGDFAVLVQSNRDFASIEDALSSFEIPYVTLAASGYLKRQEVYDIENVLKFLCCPEDSQALLGVLRSPMFGLSDDVMHSLAADHKGSLWSAVRNACRKRLDCPQELETAHGVLNSLRHFSASRPLGETVSKIITDTKYDIVSLAVPGGRQKSRNLWKLASLANEHGDLSVGEFLRMLEKMRELNVKQSHAPLDAGCSVKLMTIHGSKGLEFPAVALPALGGEVFRSGGKLLFHHEYGIAFDPTREKKATKPSLHMVSKWLEREMEEAERKRLLYVAMTRPRDYLGLFMERGGQSKPSFKTWLQAVLSLDRDGAVSAEGIHQIGGSGGIVSYLVSALDRETARDQIAELSGRLLSFGGSTREMSGVVDQNVPASEMFSLVPPLQLEETDAVLNWQEALRVTPSSPDQAVEATTAGTFFHAIMQHFFQRLEEPSRQLLEELARTASIKVVHPRKVEMLLNEGAVLIEKFKQSNLYDLMRKSKRRISEAPYTLASSEQRWSGRPDLLLLDESEQWHVIDYKTDHFDPSEIDRQMRKHRHQLEEYVEHIERLTGVTAKPALYFAQHGILKDFVREAAFDGKDGYQH